jgi:hypothetical protein
MPDSPGTRDSLELLRHDHGTMAQSIGVLVKRLDEMERTDLADLKQAKAIRAVEDKHLDERLDRIEASLQAVYGLGKWLLATIGSVLVVAVLGFILKGGPLG